MGERSERAPRVKATGALRILVLTLYYPPDLSAGSFRTKALVDSLLKQMPAGSRIDVITTLPNRYHSFNAEAATSEPHPSVSVFRIPLPKHKSGMWDQSRAFLHFARGAGREVEGKSYDLVFATSSRLWTAALGAELARRKNARLYLDIRDIFVDTIGDVLPKPLSWLLNPALSLVERRAISRADGVNLVSPGFAGYFESRYPGRRFSYFTNAIDDDFIAAAPVTTKRLENKPVTILYAGNLGEGQGLHTIVPPLARALGPGVRFRIIGDGGRKAALQGALEREKLSNIELSAPMERRELIRAYQAADVLFLHLNSYAAFKKVLPSKIFEYAALGKPILAGVSGYAAEFVAKEIENAAVFAPCDADGAIRAFEKLLIETAPRPAFLAKYTRANISRAMADDVLMVVRSAKP